MNGKKAPKQGGKGWVGGFESGPFEFRPKLILNYIIAKQINLNKRTTKKVMGGGGGDNTKVFAKSKTFDSKITQQISHI